MSVYCVVADGDAHFAQAKSAGEIACAMLLTKDIRAKCGALSRLAHLLGDYGARAGDFGTRIASASRTSAPAPYLCKVSAIPLRSRFTIRPIWLPVSSRIAPLWLVSTIACGPRPTVAPTPPAA